MTPSLPPQVPAVLRQIGICYTLSCHLVYCLCFMCILADVLTSLAATQRAHAATMFFHQSHLLTMYYVLSVMAQPTCWLSPTGSPSARTLLPGCPPSCKGGASTRMYSSAGTQHGDRTQQNHCTMATALHGAQQLGLTFSGGAT